MFSRRMSTVVTVVIVLLVTFALVASALPVFAAPAAAAVPEAAPAGRPALLPLHARLVTTAPADGATVATAARVTLTFSEDVDARFLVLKVTGPAGAEAQGRPSVKGRTVSQPLTADLPAGAHTVAYRVVSVDGHPVAGTFSFTTTAAPATPTTSPSASPSASPTTTAGASPSAGATSPSATPTASPLASPATAPAAATSGVPGWVWVVGVVLVLLVVGGLAAARRGGSAERDAPRGPRGDDGRSDDPDGAFRG